MSVSLLLGFTSLFVTGDPPKEDVVKQELEKLRGSWIVIAAEEEGKAIEELKSLVGTKITFQGNDAQAFGDEKQQKLKVRVDPSKKPCHIDFVPDKDAKDRPTLSGIYLLDGDTLKIGFPLGKGSKKIDPKTKEVIEEKFEPLVRPTGLGTKDTYVLTLKREIKK